MQLTFFLLAILTLADSTSYSNIWSKFKVNFSKSYSSLSEEKFRYSTFKFNYEKIQKHNEKYRMDEVSYYLRVNQFADMSETEMRNLFDIDEPSPVDLDQKLTFDLPEGAVVPDSIDWRRKGAVLPVENEGQCFVSFAFSALGAIEGQNIIKHNVSVALSKQEIVDCSKTNHGCLGGNTTNVYNYIQNNGISTEISYPYRHIQNFCQNGTDSKVKVTGFVEIPKTEEALKQAVGTIGPISVKINGDDIIFYGGGIFDQPNCAKYAFHYALAVGYGTENKTDYWIIKNSWGEKWGEKGYIRMSRNKNQQCGISTYSNYPILA